MTEAVQRHEVRREEDDELLGFISEDAGINARWWALTVFGGVLGEHPDADTAQQHVLAEGLASLAETWWIDLGDGWEPCSLVEASPERLVVIRRHPKFDATPVPVPTGTPVRLTPPT